MSKKNDGAGLNSRLIRRPIQRWAPLFILPVFAAFCIGFVWPFLQGIYLSFCTFNIPKDAKWVGLTNYSKIWTDVSFWNAFKNTAFFAVVWAGASNTGAAASADTGSRDSSILPVSRMLTMRLAFIVFAPFV